MWEVYNWIQAGFISLSLTEYFDLDIGTAQALSILANEIALIDEEDRKRGQA